MGTYNVKIYQTGTLSDERGRTPSYRFRDYIQGAFGYVSNHSVDVDIMFGDPYMYSDDETDENDGYAYEQRVLDGNADVGFPCYGGAASYDGIGFYFEDWLACNTTLSDDTVYVLLTASVSGGGGGGHTIIRSTQADHSANYAISVVEQGYRMPDAPSSFTRYEPADDSTSSGRALDAIQTGMHELGHAFMHDFPEYNVSDHNVGIVSKTTDNHHWTSPMGLNGDDYNSCYDLPYNRPGSRRWDMVWADCCEGKWQYPFE